MALTAAEKARLKRAGLRGLNKPKRTPNHKTKKAVVAVRVGGKVKIILPVNRKPKVVENRPITYQGNKNSNNENIIDITKGMPAAKFN